MRMRLEIEGLGLTLGWRHLLDGVDLAVAKGELHALLGANGAGKSSLALGIKHTVTRPYRPPTHGEAERFIQN